MLVKDVYNGEISPFHPGLTANYQLQTQICKTPLVFPELQTPRKFWPITRNADTEVKSPPFDGMDTSKKAGYPFAKSILKKIYNATQNGKDLSSHDFSGMIVNSFIPAKVCN